MKKPIILFIVIIIIVCSIWFYESQSISEGYILEVGDKEMLVIDSSRNTNIKAMTPNEISEAYKTNGTFYKIPIVNSILNTKFRKGQKVKIFWSGEVLQSLPGRVQHTSFITIEKQRN